MTAHHAPQYDTLLSDSEAKAMVATRHDIREISDLVSFIEPNGQGIPVLFRQYGKFDATYHAFDMDRGFNTVDGFIHAMLPTSDPKTLSQYLGKDGAKKYLEHHHRLIRQIRAGPRTYFRENPLRATEIGLLEKMGLKLDPFADAQLGERPAQALRRWMESVDRYFADPANGEAIESAVKTFLVDFVNKPGGGYIVGDTRWDKARQISRWEDFFRMPLYYDLNGKVLTMNGQPVQPEMKELPASELDGATKLYPQVVKNLKVSVTDAVSLMESGAKPYADDKTSFSQQSILRRHYLQLKLIERGKRMAGG